MTVRNGGFPYRDTPCGFDEASVSPNACEGSPFGVPRIVLPLSGLSSSGRKQLIHRLRQELFQIRSFQQDFELPNLTRGKSSRCSAGPGKKVLPLTAAKPSPVSTCTMLRLKRCETLLKRLMSHQSGFLFNTPVDVVKLNIPDYFTIIKHPMDLGTVKSKLTSGAYSTPSEFAADVRLTFSNAMTYNPPGNGVYVIADSLSKFFEVRWKTIDKKSISRTKSEPCNLATHADQETAMSEPSVKKRMVNAVNHGSFFEPAKRVMADEDRVKLGRDLASLTEFPVDIINFLRDHRSKEWGSGDDEIEIDINDLTHDALFQLRDLLDDFSRENQKKDPSGQPCVLELLHGSGPGSSLMQHYDGSEMEDEDVDVGNNEHLISRISPVRIEKDMALGSSSGYSSLESVPDDPTTTRLLSSPKGPERMDWESPLDGATSTSPRRKSSVSGSNQLEDAPKEEPSSVDCRQDGNSVENEKQLPPEKRYRAALLKNRFADIISKAREKTLNKNEGRDPEKLRREREELELQKKKEKARLQAEAEEAEEARRKAEEEAAAEAAREAKRKLELEREAARQALVEMEKSVEINENSRFLKDLELLKYTEEEHLRNRTREDDEGLGVFGFGGSNNPLEQLGLFMKHDDDDDEDDDDDADPLAFEEVEEGEIYK